MIKMQHAHPNRSLMHLLYLFIVLCENLSSRFDLDINNETTLGGPVLRDTSMSQIGNFRESMHTSQSIIDLNQAHNRVGAWCEQYATPKQKLENPQCWYRSINGKRCIR